MTAQGAPSRGARPGWSVAFVTAAIWAALILGVVSALWLLVGALDSIWHESFDRPVWRQVWGCVVVVGWGVWVRRLMPRATFNAQRRATFDAQLIAASKDLQRDLAPAPREVAATAVVLVVLFVHVASFAPLAAVLFSALPLALALTTTGVARGEAR